MSTAHLRYLTEIFERDELCDFQWRREHSSTSFKPEHELMAAVLLDAAILIDDGRTTERDKSRVLKEAIQWVESESKEYLFSFENICQALGLNSALVRRAILKSECDVDNKRRRVDNAG